MDTPLFDSVVHDIVAAALAALVPLIVAIVVKLLQKVHIDLSETKEARLRYYVQKSILGAEEQVETLVKNNVLSANPQVKTQAKLDAAVVAVMEKQPKVTQAEAVKLVTEELPQMGLGAAKPSFQPAMTPAPPSSPRPLAS